MRSRSRAADLVRSGHVRVDGHPVTKPAHKVRSTSTVWVSPAANDYVGRGAGKLLSALTALPVPIAGRRALDVGACTGGFTQVLLNHGAARVYALDVGHGQLAPELRGDPRVVNLEGVNARDLDADSLPEASEVIVADLSFISLTLVLPALVPVAAPAADALVLVKPQFEAGRAALDGTGVVRSAQARADAVVRVAQVASDHGLTPCGVVPSAVPGSSGNREYFLWATRAAGVLATSMSDLHAVVLQDGGTAAPTTGPVARKEAQP